MIYIVKCKYCDKTYIVDTDKKQKSFLCPSCSGANGLKEVEVQYKSKEELKVSTGKSFEDIWGEARGLDTIKAYRADCFPIQGDYTYSKPEPINWWRVALTPIMPVILALFLMLLLSEGMSSCRQAEMERVFEEQHRGFIEMQRQEYGDEFAEKLEERLWERFQKQYENGSY